MEGRKIHKDNITVCANDRYSTGCVEGNFSAEKYEGTPLLDTSAEIKITDLCITWEDRQKLMEELAELIRRYQL